MTTRFCNNAQRLNDLEICSNSDTTDTTRFYFGFLFQIQQTQHKTPTLSSVDTYSSGKRQKVYGSTRHREIIEEAKFTKCDRVCGALIINIMIVKYASESRVSLAIKSHRLRKYDQKEN